MSVIYGERIRMRAPERSDIPIFVRWFNDPEVTVTLFNYLPISEADEEKWFEDMLKRPMEEHPLTAEIQEDGEWMPIGNIGLMGFGNVNRSAEVGIVIGEKEYWNQGYGTEMMDLMLKHCFETLNLNRVMLRVYDFNERARHVYQKIGFVHEGTMRQALYKMGKYYDVHIMSVLREEWESRA